MLQVGGGSNFQIFFRVRLTNNVGNANKLKEVSSILGEDRLTNKKLDLEEIQGTIEEISTHKAKSAARIVSFICFFDRYLHNL